MTEKQSLLRYVAFVFYWMSPPDNIGPYGWVIKSGRQLFPHLPFSDLSHFSNIPAMPVSEPQVKLHNQDIAKMQTYPDCFSLEEYQSSCNSSQFTSGAKFSDWNLWPNFQLVNHQGSQKNGWLVDCGRWNNHTRNGATNCVSCIIRLNIKSPNWMDEKPKQRRGQDYSPKPPKLCYSLNSQILQRSGLGTWLRPQLH